MSSALLAGLLFALLIVASASILLLQQRLNRHRVDAAGLTERLGAKERELAHLTAEHAAIKQELTNNTAELQSNREELTRLVTSIDLERSQFKDKLDLLNQSKEQLGETFKNMANEIFEAKTKSFSESSKHNIATLLNPLQDKIAQFEKRVEETYDKESKERFSLVREIKSLQELNNRISQEAVNLTNALKADNKAQGTWGEFVLESILEKSGLVKGREYEVQVSLKTEDGSKSQPDVVVHLPESRDIIVDSKVSLTAWDALCSCDESGLREELLKQHVASIRQHVKSLSGKDYQKLAGINSLDYVFLFMPIEAAYSAAMQADKDLFQFAFEKNIIFVVPTTLLTTLKTVQNLWRLAQQNQNANEIADRAGALYDKFVAFVDDLDEIGHRIDATRKSFDKAQIKLVSGRGNLIRRAEHLKELGAKTSKKQKTGLIEAGSADALIDSPAADAEPEEGNASEEKTRH